MLSWKFKGVLALLAVTVLMEATPRQADAFIFRWWRARRAERVAYYPGTAVFRPIMATPQPSCGTCAPACPAPAPCAQQVCSYVPQVSYRTVYRQVPVTVYRPVTTVDPCTGCPQTAMQPCTSVTYQAQRVPVTSYRQVCQMVPVAPACPTCPAPAAAAPAFSGMPAAPAPSGCSSCGVPQASYSVPSANPAPMAYPGPSSSLTPTPSQGGAPMTVPGNSNGGAADTTPSLPAGQVPFQGSSTRRIENTYPQTSPALRPLPDLERSNQNNAPAILNPDDQTARLDNVREGAIVPISWETTAPAKPIVEAAEKQEVAAAPVTKPATKRLDDSGWRPAF